MQSDGRAGSERYLVDGFEPSDVVCVKGESGVCEALRDAFESDMGVVPWSGGTRMSVGNLPLKYDVALDLSGLSSQIDHVAGDMTVVCDAGVRVSDLASTLGDEGQRLPFQVGGKDSSATIGGSVASNAASRLRPRFGGIRDWIIGMRIVLADGVATKSGGRVVKNVQGYDLHRLHTGAYGTLGVITEVALKLVPMAKGTRTVAMWFDQLESAEEGLRQVGSSGLNVESARLYVNGRASGMIRELAAERYMDFGDESGDADMLMLIQVSGSGASLSRQTDEIVGLGGVIPSLGYEVLPQRGESESWEHMEGQFEGCIFRAEVSVKPSESLRLMRDVMKCGKEIGISDSVSGAIDVGYGSLLLALENCDAGGALRLAKRCVELAREAGGSVLIESCPTRVKSDLDVFGVDPSLERLMRQTKGEFDPKSVLNPGRYAFRI